MKKKLILLLVLIIGLIFCSCGKKTDDNEEVVFEENNYPYKTKIIFEEDKDGWYYYMRYVTNNTEANNMEEYVYARFSAMNLRYQNMDGFSIDVIDESTGEVMYESSVAIADLGYSDEYEEEVEAIENFFTEKMYSDKITMEDLDDLKVEKFDKEQILCMFNEIVDLEYDDYGKYVNLSTRIKAEEEYLDGYKWQIGMIICHGYIDAIEIELIYDDNKHLSDKVIDKTASKEEIEAYNYIEELEENIIENQNFLCDKNMKDKKIANIDFSRLYDYCKFYEECAVE